MAIDHYQQAASIAVEIGDRRIEANALVNLANAHVALGRSPLKPLSSTSRRCPSLARFENPWGEGAILTDVALVYEELGRTDEAEIELYRQALEILDQIEAPNAEVVRRLLADVRP